MILNNNLAKYYPIKIKTKKQNQAQKQSLNKITANNKTFLKNSTRNKHLISNKLLIRDKTKKIMKGATINSNFDKSNFDKLYVKNKKGEWIYKYYKPSDDSTISKNPRRCMCVNYVSENDFNTYDRCPNEAIHNSDFCSKHQNCKSYLQKLLSGDEPEPDQQLWKDPLVEGSHNCYSYFLNRQVKAVREKCSEICHNKYKSIDECIEDSGCGDLKPQPGDFDIIKRTGNDKSKERVYKCPEMNHKILADNPTLIPVDFNTKCPRGYYKGALTLEPNSTYHFYKQMRDGLFYHKPGLNPVSRMDSPFDGEKGRPIYVPHFANRDYSKDTNNNNDDDGINYTTFCNYYCIPQNKIVHKNLA